MNVTQVYRLYRAYMDEPDQTFISDADAESFLAQGYEEFRSRVYSLDSSIYAIEQDIVVSGPTYNLETGTVKILGPEAALTAPRMLNMVSIYQISGTTSVPTGELLSVGTPAALAASSSLVYYFRGNTLNFPWSVSQTLRMLYIPGYRPADAGYVDWTLHAAADTEHIDDMTQFHDLIALLAYKQYAILDNAINQPLYAQLETRLLDLRTYIEQRNFGGPQYVGQVSGGYGYY